MATSLVEPIWVEIDQVKMNKENAARVMATHWLIHPDYIILVDECGSNTSLEGDGAVGGKEILLAIERCHKILLP